MDADGHAALSIAMGPKEAMDRGYRLDIEAVNIVTKITRQKAETGYETVNNARSL
jgi:hypothetical protein